MRFSWQLLPSEKDRIQGLSRELGTSPLVAQLLIQRGLTDPQEARQFLHPSLDQLHDPFLMKDMDRVVGRILEARDKQQKVLIYGDYDVDGITSTVVLKRALEMLGLAADFYIPRRLQEGYGIKTEVIRRVAAEGYDLVLTVDSGIRAFEPAAAARELGLDLIITDHHLPDRKLPPAYAIVNPHRADCSYPDKNLAAVGVVFKIVHALFRHAGKESVLPHFLKLVAIGTVADLVPLSGENRVIVRFGLEGLADPRNPGLRALLDGVGLGQEVSLVDVGFKLAPRINAVTRMGGGREVVDLFFNGRGSAQTIVQGMNAKNSLRQREEQRILAEIEERLKSDPEMFDRKFLVIAGQEWHRGVIGIVASRLVDRFHRPSLVLGLENGTCQGSGRSIPGFSILEALDSSCELLDQYGGHEQAVGCMLREEFCTLEGLDELSRRLNAYADDKLSREHLIPSLRIDSELAPEELSLELYREVEQLAPFGVGNPVPVFASRGVNVIGGPWVLKERHLKLRIQCNGSGLDAIWWRYAGRADEIHSGSQVDLAYTMSRETYRGEEKLMLTIRDLSPQGNSQFQAPDQKGDSLLNTPNSPP